MWAAHAGLHRFRLPPPSGVSQELRQWMLETAELLISGNRLQRLNVVREERQREELKAKQAQGPAPLAPHAEGVLVHA